MIAFTVVGVIAVLSYVTVSIGVRVHNRRVRREAREAEEYRSFGDYADPLKSRRRTDGEDRP